MALLSALTSVFVAVPLALVEPPITDVADDETKPRTEVIVITRPADADAGETEPVTEHFRLEIAADSASISRGLGGRKSLKEYQGMLFVYSSEGFRSFWMKNCLIDIDVIFLDSDGRIVRMHEMKKEPPRRPGESMSRYEGRLRSYKSVRRARFAMELKAGWIRRLGLQAGDLVTADWKRIADHAKR